MKPSLTILILILAQSGVSLSIPFSTLENEVDFGQIENIKEFRESYSIRMRSFMNNSADPCDDFYAYSCGNYPKVIEDIEITLKQNSLYDMARSMDKIIDKILLKERQPDEEFFDELQKVKQFVEVCDSAQLWPLAPKQEYLGVLKAIGGFPAVDPTWNASAFDWFNMTAHLVRYGVVGLVKEEIFMRFPFPPSYDIAKFGFGFDIYPDNIATKDSLGYVYNAKMMEELLDIYGVTGSKADKVIEEIIDFWRAALILQNSTSGSCIDSFLEDDSEENKFTQWNSLFEITWNSNDSSMFDFSVSPCDSYFNKLNKMAANKSEALANYMALKFLYTMQPQVKSMKFQHQDCLRQVKQAMPMVLTHFYMKEHFSEEVRIEVKEMISQLVKSFTILVETSEWLDEPTRFGILDTLDTLSSTVGQVVDPISFTYIKESKKLNFTRNYAANNLELAKFKVDMEHYAFLNSNTTNSTVPLEILKAIWANAFYDNTEHHVNVLAGILFPPMFHPLLPKSINYGGLGFIIGHEIVHSLDPRGRSSEKHYKEIHAWSEKSRKAMKKNSECFIQHHSDYIVPELNIKLIGQESLTETVCDSGGLRGSLAAYRKVYKDSMKNKDKHFEQMETLPGLDLTPDQTFFLNFAQVYCAKYEPKHYWNEIYAGYPMDRYRVILPLQNFDEFSKVFNCPLDSPMNPAKKCRMW